METTNQKKALERRIERIFDDEERFFRTIKKEKEEFWKCFENKQIDTETLQKIKELLELTEDETLSIFFNESIGQQQAKKFYTLMLKIVRTLPEEERLVFLNTFDQKFSILKK